MESNQTVRLTRFPFDLCPAIFACNNTPLPGTPLDRSKAPTGLQAQLLLCITTGVLCFLLFCILRVRWSAMYSPRLCMKKHAPVELPTSLFGWIIPLLKTPHSVVLEKVGLDAVVMLQFLLMGAKLFGLCGFFGVVVLYPIRQMGGDLFNSTDPVVNSTSSSVPLASEVYSPSFLWVYLFFTYFFCFATFYFTFVNYRDYVRIRREFLMRIAKTLPARTVLITGIPQGLRSDQKLAEYFETLGVGVVDSVHIIRHVHRLLDYIKERAQYLRKLETAYANFWGNPCHIPTYDPDRLLMEAEGDHSLHAVDWSTDSDSDSDSLPSHRKRRQRPAARDGFLGLIGKPVDAIEFYTERFNKIDSLVLRARKLGKFLPTSVGFVTFEDAISANVVAQILIDSTPFRLRAQLAPEPRDVLWENIAMHARERAIRKFMVFIVLIFLVFFWVIPISYFSALTSEDSLQNYFPWLIDLASKNKILRQLVQGFLPTLGVVVFMSILPIIFNALSVVEGFTTRSEAEESSFSKHFFFLLFNVLLVFTISSALFKTLKDMLEDPTQIANLLASSLPQVAPFFVNYIILQGIMLLPIQLLQIGPIILQLFFRTFYCKTPRDYGEVLAPRMYNYGWGYPVPVFLFVILLVYSTISPLILVFGTIYYCLAYLVFKYQLLYVYFHPYEVAGRMWPLVFSRIIVGMLIFELTSAGLFLLNRAYPLAVLCVPLIILTIAFKFSMDAAYLRSTINLPVRLLSQRLGPLRSTAQPMEAPELQPSVSSQSNSRHPLATRSEAEHDISSAPKTTIRRKRTVLDEDDYEAEPRKYTDFREPPMTLLDGILNTGMKRYGHPAMFGVLPQLWLPIKAGDTRHRSLRKPSHRRSIAGPDERQPLLSSSPVDNSIPSHIVIVDRNIPPRHEAQAQEEEEDDDDDDSSNDDVGTYYHHPERRLSRSLYSRSYGATGSSQPRATE
ncbi:uncharacterized protein BYT42DRAFT_128832 [Radiomyces spectabilis]|uniref:uncharacterized protein n=1 Tax=Radiomyces spectabilis TaxID=64574 RepID=UPI0022210CD0|nr:uncharacterized protein BYT42DRAFT_128832 [Radiomyces spectabilis]KAI8367508.1 hypothetical protein BYT42DRAFT_128832 [Radiomyces spectabilis]